MGEFWKKVKAFWASATFLRGSLEVLVWLSILATAIKGFIDFRAATTKVPNDPNAIIILVIAVVGALGAAAKVWSGILDGKTARRLDTEFQRGIQDGLARWRDTSTFYDGAFGELHKFLYKADNLHAPPSGTTSMDVYDYMLDSILLNVKAIFGEKAGSVSANIAVPMENEPKLKIVRMQPRDGKRRTKREFVLDASKPSQGAAKAFLTCQTQYILDKNKDASFDASRPYRAIISWPILSGDDGKCLGVLNVDSTEVAGFELESDSEKRETLALLCAPALRGLALILSDQQTVQRDLRATDTQV